MVEVGKVSVGVAAEHVLLPFRPPGPEELRTRRIQFQAGEITQGNVISKTKKPATLLQK